MAANQPLNLSLEEATRLVATMVNDGELTQGMALAEQLLDVAPQNPDVLFVAAGVAWRSAQHERAVTLQRRLIETQPTDPKHHERLINFLQETRDTAGALAAAEAAVAQCAADPLLFNALGLLQFNLGRTEESLKTFDQAISLFQDNTTAHHNRSLPLLAEGRLEDAVSAFTQGLTPWTGDAERNDETNNSPHRAVYDGAAATYDDNRLQQSWGPATAALIDEVYGSRSIGRMLDVCCGTGAVGRHVTQAVAHATGIDFSANMLAKACQTGFYGTLIEADMIVGLAGLDDPFDLMTCSCALYHQADLAPFFQHSARLLARRGYLIFSVDAATDDLQIGQSAPGEFAHSRAYLRKLALDYEFAEISVTINAHRAYPGFWCVFQRYPAKSEGSPDNSSYPAIL